MRRIYSLIVAAVITQEEVRLRRLEKTYCALVFFLFFLLFLIIYAENVARFAVSQRAFMVSVIALIGMVSDLVLMLAALRADAGSNLVSKNTVVAAWMEHRLNERQKLISAAVNIFSLVLFVALVWLLRSYLAGLVMVVAIFGFQISELLRARYKSIHFWVFKFNVPVFVFILVFIVLFLLGGLQ